MRIEFKFEAGDSLATLEEVQRRCESAYLKSVVDLIGHRGHAAAVLGISRKNLWEKLKAFGLAESSLRSDAALLDELRQVQNPFSIAA